MSSNLATAGADVMVFGLEDETWDEQSSDWRGAYAKAFAVSAPAVLGRSPALRKALCEYDPDVIHTHGLWMHTSADVAMIGKRGKHYIVSPHGMLEPWGMRHSRLKKLVARFAFEDRHIKGASCLHALNKEEANSICAYGYKGPIVIVANGVDIPANASPVRVDRWVREHSKVYRPQAVHCKEFP